MAIDADPIRVAVPGADPADPRDRLGWARRPEPSPVAGFGPREFFRPLRSR